MVTRVTQEKAEPKRLSKYGEWARAQDLLPKIGVNDYCDEQACFGEGGLTARINGKKCIVIPAAEWEPIAENTKFEMLTKLSDWVDLHENDETATAADMRAVMG